MAPRVPYVPWSLRSFRRPSDTHPQFRSVPTSSWSDSPTITSFPVFLCSLGFDVVRPLLVTCLSRLLRPLLPSGFTGGVPRVAPDPRVSTSHPRPSSGRSSAERGATSPSQRRPPCHRRTPRLGGSRTKSRVTTNPYLPCLSCSRGQFGLPSAFLGRLGLPSSEGLSTCLCSDPHSASSGPDDQGLSPRTTGDTPCPPDGSKDPTLKPRPGTPLTTLDPPRIRPSHSSHRRTPRDRSQGTRMGHPHRTSGVLREVPTATARAGVRLRV